MALEGCYFCLKYLVFAFNFVFWILGCGLMAVGLWARFSPETLKLAGGKAQSVVFERLLEETAASDEVAIYGIIALGATIMVIGFLGCCGAIKENKAMLGLFFVFLLIIFTVLLALGVYIVVHKDRVKNHIGELIQEQVIKAEKGVEESTKFMEYLQTNFQCCGALEGIIDYKAITNSGCEEEFKNTPCALKLYNGVKFHGVLIAGVAVGVAIVMLLGMIFSMLLCCAIREQI